MLVKAEGGYFIRLGDEYEKLYHSSSHKDVFILHTITII